MAALGCSAVDVDHFASVLLGSKLCVMELSCLEITLQKIGCPSGIREPVIAYLTRVSAVPGHPRNYYLFNGRSVYQQYHFRFALMYFRLVAPRTGRLT